jgi:hypothetical protein
MSGSPGVEVFASLGWLAVGEGPVDGNVLLFTCCASKLFHRPHERDFSAGD